MTKNIDTINAAVAVIIKAAVLATMFSGRVRKRSLKRLSKMDIEDKDKEIIFLRDKVYQLKLQVSILQKGLQKKPNNKPYPISEKLFILNYMEAFQIPRRRVTEHLGIARSTLYRWLHKIEEQAKSYIPANKTPSEISLLVWEMAKDNVGIGRVRIANQIGLLNIFISASSVRNILNGPKPPKESKPSGKTKSIDGEPESRSIPAWYPNHLWSIDTTEVRCWGIWVIHVFVAIDHYSRKVMAVVPLEGQNAGWNINALEDAIEKHGKPKHLISDQAGVFTGEAFAELIDRYKIKHRLGAINKHGSIAVTERVNKTLKYEWLNKVAIVKGFDHLTKLCTEFETWYNSWRPHMTLDGIRPDDLYYGNKPDKPKPDAKTIPCNIEKYFFRQTRVTGYRLKEAA